MALGEAKKVSMAAAGADAARQTETKTVQESIAFKVLKQDIIVFSFLPAGLKVYCPNCPGRKQPVNIKQGIEKAHSNTLFFCKPKGDGTVKSFSHSPVF